MCFCRATIFVPTPITSSIVGRFSLFKSKFTCFNAQVEWRGFNTLDICQLDREGRVIKKERWYLDYALTLSRQILVIVISKIPLIAISRILVIVICVRKKR